MAACRAAYQAFEAGVEWREVSGGAVVLRLGGDCEGLGAREAPSCGRRQAVVQVLDVIQLRRHNATEQNRTEQCRLRNLSSGVSQHSTGWHIPEKHCHPGYLRHPSS